MDLKIRNLSRFLLLFFVLALIVAGSVMAANVVPFTLGKVGGAKAKWKTTPINSGSYSVKLKTTMNGDYAYMSFDPIPATIDDITSLSFYYNHVSDGGSSGPRIAILIDDNGNYYLAVSGAASTNIGSWVKADGISGSQLTTPSLNADEVWWYGTCNDAQCSVYNQVGGPVNFAAIQANLNGDIDSVSVYMGVVDGVNVSIGVSYIDDVELNGETYYSRIQEAVDTANPDDIINVADGVYDNEVFPIIVNKTNLTIKARGAVAIINASASNRSAINISSDYATIGGSGFTIYGGGNATSYEHVIDVNADYSTIQDNTIIGYNGNTADIHIASDKGTGHIIKGNTFRHRAAGEGWGIFAENLTDSLIQNNLCYGDSQTWGSVEGAPGTCIIINDADDVTIKDNLAYNVKYSWLTFIAQYPRKDITGYMYEDCRNAHITMVNITNNTVYDIIKSGSKGINFKPGAKGGQPAGWTDHADLTIGPGVMVEYNIFHSNSYAIKIDENKTKPGGTGHIIDEENLKVNFNRIYDNADYGFYNEQEGIIDATMNWWGACDGPSGDGPGSGDAVFGNINYTPWLGVCIENKTNVTCAFETDNITLSVDIGSILDNVEDIWFSITLSGVNENKTPEQVIGNTRYYTIPSTDLVAGTNVFWNVYANDSYGDVYSNGNMAFYINRRTNLSVNQSAPDGLSNWYVTEPTFTLTSPDATAIWYMWGVSTIFGYAGPFGLENIPNPPAPDSAGTLELNYWSDVACGTEDIQARTFTIDLVNPVIKDLNPANNSIIFNDRRPEVNAYIDELYGSNSGINLTNVTMRIDGGLVAADVDTADTLDAIVSHTPPADLALGKHNVTVNATDIAGRTSGLVWFFELNETPVFTMMVTSPQDAIYGSRRVPFNITLDADVELLEYINHDASRPRWRRLCRDCDEYGSKTKKIKRLNEGNNSITIRATDGFGNVKEENISLFIDSIVPRISRTLPRKNKVTNGTGFYIKYTEDNLQKVELFWNGNKVLNCDSGRNQECTVDIDLSAHDGEFIDYYFEVSDLATTVRSRTTIVEVDTTPPALTVNSPEDGETYGRRVPFNITVSESLILEYYDDLRGRWVRLCNNCDDYGASRTRVRSFRRGNYHLLIRAMDKAGQIDTWETSFEVDY